MDMNGTDTFAWKPGEFLPVVAIRFLLEITEKVIFSDFVKQLEDDIRGAGLVYAEGLMRRFVCAQLAKPFVVLTGLSGSGKTKLAQAFTEWIAVENTAKIVPVGADWTYLSGSSALG